MRERRDALGLSVADLSERAQCPTGLIHSLEDGELVDLDLFDFVHLAKGLGLSMDLLLRHAEQKLKYGEAVPQKGGRDGSLSLVDGKCDP